MAAGSGEVVTFGQDVLLQQEGDPGQFHSADLERAKRILKDGVAARAVATTSEAEASGREQSEEGQASIPGGSIAERTSRRR